MKVAVVGAGWAGMAAAIAHVQAGRSVTVFEAARSLGGRARAVAATLPCGTAVQLDNGQHILIGAYTESLRLMQLVGVDPEAALLRLPLTLRFPDGGGLELPDTAPPWDALLGIAGARGWNVRDKVALMRTAAAWQWRGFRCPPATSVAALCATLTPRLRSDFIEPLCVAALNTPADQASGQVFLRVLHDSLFSGHGGSNLLLPRTHLGRLFPDAAAHWLNRHRAQVLTGQRVAQIAWQPGGGWQLATAEQHHAFDHVTLACSPWEAQRLVAGAQGLPAAEPQAAARQWADTAGSLRFEAITTVFAHAQGARLVLPMLALRSGAEGPAQFVFDRGQLDGHQGLLAFVASASPADRAAVEQQVLVQAAAQLSLPALQPVQTIVEKRATFACTPGLRRPAQCVLPRLTACGDYVDGPYPATLEGAVRSGTAAAKMAER